MVNFILGRRGSGKTYRVLKEIKGTIKEAPLGPPIILIAPKQVTYSIEESFAKDPSVKGSMRASVYGFDRLAWRMMSEEGGLSEEIISNAGIEMLTFITMRSLREDMHLFNTSSKYFGFSQKLTEIIKEFKRYNVTPTALFDLIDSDIPVRTKDKLHDIAIVYQALEQRKADLYVQSEDILHFLFKLIPESKTIKTADIYIDGFHNFTTMELQVIAQLAKYAKSLTITLTLDTHALSHTFRKTSETFDLLKQVFEQFNVSYEVNQLSDTARFKNPSLKILEQNFDSVQPSQSSESNITIQEAVNMRNEVEAIVRKIHREARLNQFRYADQAILYRDVNYVPIFKEYFKRYDIPYFTDAERVMIHHPVIELIRSLLDFSVDTWTIENLFRALKTGLIVRSFDVDDRYLIDMLENAIIERGINFNDWANDRKFYFDEKKPYNIEDWERMNAYRKFIFERINTILLSLKSCSNAYEFASSLYKNLEMLNIPEYLMAEKDRLSNEGNYEAALDHEQVYEALIRLMDDMVDLMGEEPMDYTTLKEMFDVGLAALKYKSIPQKMDEVQLLNLDLARVENIKSLYICGFNDEILPRTNKDIQLINDQDKSNIETYSDIMLAPSTLTLTLDESFVAYLALTQSTESLNISYSLTDAAGEGRKPSRYINQLKAIFPELKIQQAESNQPEILMETIDGGIPYAVKHLNEIQWLPVISWLKHVPSFQQIYQLKDYRNHTLSLKEYATKLYGEEIRASVSKFETFNDCPFKHFANYGLRLNERQPFVFQNFELGTIFHEALKIISEETKDHLYQMDRQSIDGYIQQTLDDLLPKVHYEVLFSKAYYQFMMRQIKNILSETVNALKFQQAHSDFKMKRFEQNFSADSKHFNVNTMYTSTRIPIKVNGQIDRIDIYENNAEAYVSLIDYKSSEHSLDLKKVILGKQMQMLTYMDAALQNHSQLTSKGQLRPGAMLYFHVKAPFESYKNKADSLEHKKKYLEHFRLNGFVVNDSEVIDHLDNQFDKKSSIIPVTRTSKGYHPTQSKLIREEDLMTLIDINRSNFVKTADRIMSGDIRVAPTQFDDRLPCEYCAFKSSCHIDPMINADDIQVIDKTFDIKEVLEEVRHAKETE